MGGTPCNPESLCVSLTSSIGYVSPYAIVSLEDGEKTNEILGCPQKI